MDSSIILTLPEELRSPRVTMPLSQKSERTFGSHVRLAFAENPTDYTGELVRLMEDIAMATRMISAGVRGAGLPRNHTSAVKPLESDEAAVTRRPTDAREFDADIATQILYRTLYHDGHLCILLSNCHTEPLNLPDNVPFGNYVLTFSALERDPVFPEYSICGTIFSVYKRISSAGQRGTVEDLLRPGTAQVAAGYVIYGNAGVLAYTIGRGVHWFSMHPNIKEYFLVEEKVRPGPGKFCFVNRQEEPEWGEKTKQLIDHMSEAGYSIQYSRSLVSDFHHLLACGGLIAVPKKVDDDNYGVHYLCTAAPLAYLMEQAGGKAISYKGRLLDVKVSDLHQKSPMFIGTTDAIDMVDKFLNPPVTPPTPPVTPPQTPLKA